MKDKRLEKKVQFTFKRKPLQNLSKEQMRNIMGGEEDNTTKGRPSVEAECTVVKLPTVNTD
ncbi:hypothetical protein OC25_00435 [Pedobacter kyungheensis]|uniref:Uncharacterized protein n=1 Tax=Pedobacter kyungheensis TaxID=1069985 RepID=A0A0C1G9Y4_9SPHI|nr:hypothetical protein [Pedobacter kyungheensis]KIA96914.1 hypothetical protein OC25_00435 [Pedobacter kyungheensis]